MRNLFACIAMLMSGCGSSAFAQETNSLEPPSLVTNLLQLRNCAEQSPPMIQPFHIVAEVLEADGGDGVLVLRDGSGMEFIQLDLRGREIEPGTRICLEGDGCRVETKNFGLAIFPGVVVDNDGIHEMRAGSGAKFLRAGMHPITIQWFNGPTEFGLGVEYQGPGLPRQPLPSSALLRVVVDPATGASNFLAGLDYRVYEGSWRRLPDFAELHPVKSGVATNVDLGVRTRNEKVGLVFNGCIKILQDGVYTFYTTSDDGSRLSVGDATLAVDILGHGSRPAVAEKLPATRAERNGLARVALEGTVKFAGVRESGGELALQVGNGIIQAEIFENGDLAPHISLNSKVRVSGVYQEVLTQDSSLGPGRLLVSSWKAVCVEPTAETTLAPAGNEQGATNQLPETAASAAAAIPLITTAAQVKALTAETAKQQLPVSIRGVATAVLADYLHGAVIQDSTKGVYIDLQNVPNLAPLQRGEYYQVEGVTGPGLFAPLVAARRVTHLGAGQLPQPLQPSWDQLFDGRLDTQYAEIEGMVIAAREQQIEMLTEGGKITLLLDDFQPGDLADFEGDLVRIRGCFFAFFNPRHELETSSLRVRGGAIDVLQPAPSDPFNTSPKSIGELLLYDPKTAPFRRLKVNGQVIYRRAGEYFLTDGTNGLRVTTRRSSLFAVGDLVDAVGFLALGGPSAELKEAVLRKTGHASLPAATLLPGEQLLLARHAGTMVQVNATLMNQWREGNEYVFELQSGFLAFRARMRRRGETVLLPPPGSQLELTGVYAPQGSRTGYGTVSGFELLLQSPADIRVLARPPWWNLGRVLVLAGILAILLCAVLLWNKELQRKVQERGRQLERESHNRQRAELQRAAEAERSRIARDLHDELGTSLTEVSLLASTGPGESRAGVNNADRLRVIAEKARALVSGLDVIVWAIDPKRNSLQSFADYVGRYATELFSASNIVCRFKIPIECQALTLTETARHSLFLAVKEALNNVIRHASATEVKLEMTQADDRLEIVIADNGRGFDGNASQGGNGLANFCERLKALDGRCQIESQTGRGTTVKFTIPLQRNSSSPAPCSEPEKSHDH